jgi:hypothetical protein
MKIQKVLIVNAKEIDEKKLSLSLISSGSDGWKRNFEDMVTNEKWIEYRMEPEYHGGGYPMLVKQPEPDTNELIQIALESENLDEIAGASIFLYTNEENDNIDFREQLIDAVEKFFENKKAELSDFDRNKLNIIIYDSNLYDSTNRRNILGKYFAEIEKDYQYFKGVSERAKRILNEIKRSH